MNYIAPRFSQIANVASKVQSNGVKGQSVCRDHNTDQGTSNGAYEVDE
jgi:hypothetical protein